MHAYRKLTQSVNRRLAEDQAVVVRRFLAEPEALAPTRRETGEAAVLDLKPAEALPVEMREDRVPASVNAYSAGETVALQQRRRNGALVFKIGMTEASCIRA
jgi:hypothetical protein